MVQHSRTGGSLEDKYLTAANRPFSKMAATDLNEKLIPALERAPLL